MVVKHFSRNFNRSIPPAQLYSQGHGTSPPSVIITSADVRALTTEKLSAVPLTAHRESQIADECRGLIRPR
jgi:hypothetical protein